MTSRRGIRRFELGGAGSTVEVRGAERLEDEEVGACSAPSGTSSTPAIPAKAAAATTSGSNKGKSVYEYEAGRPITQKLYNNKGELVTGLEAKGKPNEGELCIPLGKLLSLCGRRSVTLGRLFVPK